MRSVTMVRCAIGTIEIFVRKESECVMRGLPWRNILWGLLAVLVIVGIIFREPIVFNVKLLNVARIGKAYYEEYPFIAKNIAYGTADHQRLDIYRWECLA